VKPQFEELHWIDGEPEGTWILIAPGNPGQTRAPALPDALAEEAPRDSAQVVGGRLILADEGISYAEWLEQGLDTRDSEQSSIPDELCTRAERAERADTTIRYTCYTPGI
jgi:hypothetical protein